MERSKYALFILPFFDIILQAFLKKENKKHSKGYLALTVFENRLLFHFDFR